MTTGIAFSGGGARGIAHIGVLKAMLENGISPDRVSGTSAGAIVATLFAAGKQPEEILEFVKNSKNWKIFRLGLPNAGFAKLTYLRDQLAEMVGTDDFNALSIPLSIAISNLESGELEVRESGQLFDVVVASSSIPLVFQPVEINGKLYVDGGVLCNLPVFPLIQKVDRIIGVNVMPNVPTRKKNVGSFLGVSVRCFEMSIWANTRPELEKCDWVIEPKEVNRYHIFQFQKYRELYQIGYESAMAQMENFMRVGKKD